MKAYLVQIIPDPMGVTRDPDKPPPVLSFDAPGGYTLASISYHPGVGLCVTFALAVQPLISSPGGYGPGHVGAG